MSKNSPAVFRFDWLKSYIKVFGPVGRNSLSWWLGTMFAERIIDEYGFWPIFCLTGSVGCGKTSMLRFLWKLHSKENYEGVMSEIGRYQMYSQIHNIPVVIINPQDRSDVLELKTLYNGRFDRVVKARCKYPIVDNNDYNFYGGIYVVDGYNVLRHELYMRECYVAMFMDSSHHSPQGRRLALTLHNMTVAELRPFKKFVRENYEYIFAFFQQKYESSEFLSKSHELYRGRMKNNMVLAWIDTFERYFKSK